MHEFTVLTSVDTWYLNFTREAQSLIVYTQEKSRWVNPLQKNALKTFEILLKNKKFVSKNSTYNLKNIYFLLDNILKFILRGFAILESFVSNNQKFISKNKKKVKKSSDFNLLLFRVKTQQVSVLLKSKK